MSPTQRSQTYENAILRNLSPDCIARLGLKSVRLAAKSCVFGLDDGTRWLLFVESGSVALSLPLKDGSFIETGIFGNRSIVDASALLEPHRSLHRATVRCPGRGFVCSIQRGLLEFARGGEFHDLALSSLHFQLLQVSQIAACNGRHDAQERLCRWLLHCYDESANQHIHVTQESLAEALGVGRTTVTLIMHLLLTQGLIAYSRGNIRLIDRAGLRSRACECYQALQRAPEADSPLRDESNFGNSVMVSVSSSLAANSSRLNFVSKAREAASAGPFRFTASRPYAAGDEGAMAPVRRTSPLVYG